MTVGIVADGGVSLGTLQPARQVQVVPMRLIIDGVEVDESEELTTGDLATARSVSTAAPSPGDFLKAIESADEGEGVLVLTVAASLSSSFQSAEVASQIHGGQRVDDASQVRVLDSKSAASGQGLVVWAAARASAEAKDLATVFAEVSSFRERVRLVAEIARLDQLVRGGRIPASAAAVGHFTGIRPVFELRQSKIRPLRPALSFEGAKARILAELRRSAPKSGTLEVLGLYGNDRRIADELVDRATSDATVSARGVAKLSPVMVAHTGLDVDGLAWAWTSIDGLH